MYARARFFNGVFRCRLLALAEDIDGEAGGEGCKGTACGRIACGDEANHEDDTYYCREITAGSNGWEDVVARESFKRDIWLSGIRIEQVSEKEEEVDHDHLHDCTHYDILLRIAVVLAGERTLHHVLIQTRSSNQYENTGQELFPEIASIVDVIKEEHTRHLWFTIATQAHAGAHDKHDAEDDGEQEAGRFQ